MTTKQPVDDDIVISGGIHNDLKMCLQQALEYLELGEHDGGWVVFKNCDIQCASELVEAVFDCCCKELEKCEQRETSASVSG
jgi:hypothetical protein